MDRISSPTRHYLTSYNNYPFLKISNYHSTGINPAFKASDVSFPEAQRREIFTKFSLLPPIVSEETTQATIRFHAKPTVEQKTRTKIESPPAKT